MAELNIKVYDRTLAEVDKALEQKKAVSYIAVPVIEEEKPRNYLGMSQIGEECWRKLFYTYRKAEKKVISASGVKAIEDGYLQEYIMAMRLRMLPGIELHTVDPQNPKEQIAFSLLLGHFNGHCDGMIKGIVEAPQTWHTWENKSCNNEAGFGTPKYNDLVKLREKFGEKAALKEWDPIYYAQAIIYMHESTTKRHYLTVTSPGGRHYISIRTEYNQKHAEAIIQKAKTIIFDNDMLPSRLSDKREFYKCKWCEFQEICHDGKFADINCRTCRSCKPIKDGQFQCNRTDIILTSFNNCNDHVYNPTFIQTKLIEEQNHCCIYEIDNVKFANCTLTDFPEFKENLNFIYTSKELRDKVKFISNIKSNTKEQPKKETKKKAWE